MNKQGETMTINDLCVNIWGKLNELKNNVYLTIEETIDFYEKNPDKISNLYVMSSDDPFRIIPSSVFFNNQPKQITYKPEEKKNEENYSRNIAGEISDMLRIRPDYFRGDSDGSISRRL